MTTLLNWCHYICVVIYNVPILIFSRPSSLISGQLLMHIMVLLNKRIWLSNYNAITIKLNSLFVRTWTVLLPGCRLRVLALVQNAAGSGCGSEPWGFGTRHGPAHTLHRKVLGVSFAPPCPPPERTPWITNGTCGKRFEMQDYFNAAVLTLVSSKCSMLAVL